MEAVSNNFTSVTVSGNVQMVTTKGSSASPFRLHPNPKLGVISWNSSALMGVAYRKNWFAMVYGTVEMAKTRAHFAQLHPRCPKLQNVGEMSSCVIMDNVSTTDLYVTECGIVERERTKTNFVPRRNPLQHLTATVMSSCALMALVSNCTNCAMINMTAQTVLMKDASAL